MCHRQVAVVGHKVHSWVTLVITFSPVVASVDLSSNTMNDNQQEVNFLLGNHLNVSMFYDIRV